MPEKEPIVSSELGRFYNLLGSLRELDARVQAQLMTKDEAIGVFSKWYPTAKALGMVCGGAVETSPVPESQTVLEQAIERAFEIAQERG